MKNISLLIFIGIVFVITANAQQKKYIPKIEECSCRFMMDSNFVKMAPPNLKTVFSLPFEKIDSSFKTQCGYLIVPENRGKKLSRMIKLPFIVVYSKP